MLILLRLLFSLGKLKKKPYLYRTHLRKSPASELKNHILTYSFYLFFYMAWWSNDYWTPTLLKMILVHLLYVWNELLNEVGGKQNCYEFSINYLMFIKIVPLRQDLILTNTITILIFYSYLLIIVKFHIFSWNCSS